ncbi:RecX family protein [Eubacterium ruminantium]|nr:RecX family protein [Eubacterium ruminantium]
MPEIRVVEKSKRNLIYIDDEYIGFLYNSDIKSLELDASEDGYIIDEVRAEEITNKIYARTYEKAVSYLARAEYCSSEIRFKLKHNDYSEQMIEKVIEELYDHHYLDDRRYAEAYIRSYSDKKGRMLIENELIHKNIEKSIINEAFSMFQEDDSYSENDAIGRLIEKKYKYADLTDPKTKSKILAYFVRKGFPVDKVNNHLT